MSGGHGAGDAVLHLDSVSLAFPTRAAPQQALDAVTLDVAEGRITALVGPDGAGKTTLMRVAAGLLGPDAGQVRLLGADVGARSRMVAEQVGYMPQRFGLYEELSVAENLDLFSDLQGVARAQRAARQGELMHMTGLAPFLGRLAGKLSGGMKQKLGLACALVRAPRLLLLDEPTVGVDPVSRRELWAIVRRLVAEEGVSVLVSTAYLDETRHCDRVFVLDRGRVLGSGTPQAFIDRMRGRVHALGDGAANLRGLIEVALADPWVIDAVPERGRLRVIGRASAPAQAPGESSALPLTPLVPRFEDWFVDALTRRARAPAAPAPAVPDTPAAHGVREAGAVIQVEDVWRRFGDFAAVRGVSFSVRRGEVFGLLGANGAGKSTTFRMLCGLLPASSGRLRVGGVDMRRAPAAARARIGYVAQRFSLYSNLTVLQNLRFFAAAYGLPRRRRAERVARVMQDLELEAFADAPSGELPLGYRQRLALAGALVHEPEILFLDEATSGVDPLARREFWRRINALAVGGVTVLVTTHFMEEAEYCDRLVVMHAGGILAQGSPASIRARAAGEGGEPATMEEAFVALVRAAGEAEAA